VEDEIVNIEKTCAGCQFKLEDQIVVFFSATGLLQVRGSNQFKLVQQGLQNSEKF
jgi:hypothetical protein